MCPPPVSDKGKPLDNAIMESLSSNGAHTIREIMANMRTIYNGRVLYSSVTGRLTTLVKNGKIKRVSTGMYSRDL